MSILEFVEAQRGSFSTSRLLQWSGEIWLWARDCHAQSNSILVSAAANLAPPTSAASVSPTGPRQHQFLWIDESRLPALLAWVFLHQGRHAAQRGQTCRIDTQLGLAMDRQAAGRLGSFENGDALRQHVLPQGLSEPLLCVTDVFGFSSFTTEYGANAYEVTRRDGSRLLCEDCPGEREHCHAKEILLELTTARATNPSPWHARQ